MGCGLGRIETAFCEANHIDRGFFLPPAERASDQRIDDRAGMVRGEMQMQTPQWRSGTTETAWLSAMVDAMEQVSCAEPRGMRCAPGLRAAVEAQLARPAMPYGTYGSKFSYRN